MDLQQRQDTCTILLKQSSRMNEQLLQLLEKCDAVEVAGTESSSRKTRKHIVDRVNVLLDKIDDIKATLN